MLRALLCGAVAALLAAQTAPRARRAKSGRADAGTKPLLLGTDPPGKLRPTPADAGVAGGASDAGVDARAQEVQALRARVDALERALQQQQSSVDQLRDLNQQVQQLRQQMADAEAQREREEQAQRQHASDLQDAVRGLAQAQSALAGGNENIGDLLDSAEQTFTGRARDDVRYARDALRNRDLSTARAWLDRAAVDARADK